MSKKQAFNPSRQAKITKHVPSSGSSVRELAPSNFDLRTMFLRPTIGMIGSIGYGYYFENKAWLSNRELMRSGAMAVALFSSNAIGNSMNPHLASSKINGFRQIESMVLEPLLSGVMFAGLNYGLIDGDFDQTFI